MTGFDFLQHEWGELCLRLNGCREYLKSTSTNADSLQDQAQQFVAMSPPESYGELLLRYREAAMLAKQWQKMRQETNTADVADHYIDEIVEDSFPASDPPPFGHAHA